MAAIVRNIYRSLLECVTAGVEGRVIRQAAEKAAEVNGVSDYFEGYGDMQGDYIGHGIGIEMDEPPVIDRHCNTVLREGMVLAFEPKIIIPGWGAMSIEDTVAVTCTGYENLVDRTARTFRVY
jgi:Xaa-Pro aminopeptidase